MLAIVDAYKSGLLKAKNWWPNIVAGFIVSVVALPLSMAFAIATGVKPEQGLYTAIIAGFIVGIFGGSRVQIAGPTGAFIVILAGITAQYGIAGLQVATMLAGFILLFMGAVKLGNVIKFIPDPVIVGFTSGIGVIIFVTEWKDFLGLPIHIPFDVLFYQKVIMLLQALPNLNITTTLLAAFSLFLVLISSKISKHLPGPLVAMVVVTLLQAIFQFDNVATIGSAFGAISQELPLLQFPDVGFSEVVLLIGPAFAIALLGAIESLLSAAAADGMSGTRHDSNQELIGQGLANIVAPLFGGFAATGAIARTATNVRSGGNSPIASITQSIILVAIVLFLAPFAGYIPLCTLAAILFVVAYNMSDVPHFVHIVKHAPRYDLWVLLATFLLTILTDLVVAVNVGVILAMLFFIRQMYKIVTVEEQPHDKLHGELTAEEVAIIPKDMLIYTIQGPFFFGAAEKIEHALAITHLDPKTIVFRLKEVPFMDMTGLETFDELIQQYNKRHVNIFLCEANMRVARKLTNMGMLTKICGNQIFKSLGEVLKSIHS
jgi:SulP family sulfate permease